MPHHLQIANIFYNSGPPAAPPGRGTVRKQPNSIMLKWQAANRDGGVRVGRSDLEANASDACDAGLRWCGGVLEGFRRGRGGI